MSYNGIFVTENLLDNQLLNIFKIKKVCILSTEKPEDDWHLYEVKVSPEQVNELTTDNYFHKTQHKYLIS